jgi:hypothetical protein
MDEQEISRDALKGAVPLVSFIADADYTSSDEAFGNEATRAAVEWVAAGGAEEGSYRVAALLTLLGRTVQGVSKFAAFTDGEGNARPEWKRPADAQEGETVVGYLLRKMTEAQQTPW